jgi:type II secretory pathway component PulC
MKYKNTLISALVIVILLGAVAIGYFAFNRNNNTAQEPDNIPDTTESSNVTGKPGVTANPNEMVKDTNLTRELNNEKIFELGQIYKKGDIVFGAIVVKESSTKNEARKLGEKYFNKIKKRYKGMKVYVQVVRDGENVCQLKYGF